MKTTITLLLMMVSCAIVAQPEITEANLPHIGDHVEIAICSNAVDPGNAGANQTWIMTWLTEQEEQYFDYIAVSEAPHADSFPNANICSVSWENDYSFYGHSQNALTAEGYVITTSDEDTSLMVFGNEEQIIGLPYTMNNSFTDEFDGNSYIPGFGTFPFDGSINFEADGYGTLILPNGTYENVVRYHFTRTQTNYFGGFPAGTQTREQWAWVSADFRFWLLLMENIDDGVSISSLIWYDKNPYPATTGITQNEFKSTEIFPNPIKVGERLNIHWSEPEQATISIFRLDGGKVNETSQFFIKGNNRLDFPVVSEGLYFIQVNSETQIVSGKIMLNQ